MARIGAAALAALLLFAALAAGQQGDEAVVRFAVIGDSGTGDDHQLRIAQQMERWRDALPFEDVLMLGDNIYGPALLWWRHGSKRYFGDRFDRPYAKLLDAGVKFHASLGNHDVRTRDGRDQIEAKERFHIESDTGYYSFTLAADGQAADRNVRATGEKRGEPLVELFALNTTRFDKGKDDTEQVEWLREALAKSKARWKIVFGHHPLYSTGKRHGSDLRLRERIEPLLEGRVQVALAGHDHIYQRFAPQKGVAYFVAGSSGQLRRGQAAAGAEVAASEDEGRSFLLWEATARELRFRAIDERGRAFDCGRIATEGAVATVACGEWPGLTIP